MSCFLLLQLDQKNFFQALAICHTVQVAASATPEQPAAEVAAAKPETNKSGPPEMYSISDITEESHNSSQNSELNVSHTIETSLSTHPNGNNAQATSSDVNPLLLSDDGYKVERRKRPQVVKRSPNFARSNKIHMATASASASASASVDASGTATPQNGSTSPPIMRPMSLQFQRSTSERDLPQFEEAHSATAAALGHRRAHSYGAPNAYLSHPVGSMSPPILPGGGLLRVGSNSSRESYAAPTFTRQPTMLIRAESQRRKHEIEETIW